MNNKHYLTKHGLILLSFTTLNALAVEDPLAGMSAIQPHDDLLYNASFLNLGTGKVNTRTNSYKMDGTSNTPEMSYDWNDKLIREHAIKSVT